MENEKTRKKRVRTTSIITLLICMIDIYIIINIPEDYIILAAAMLVTLISAILTLNSWFKWKDVEEQHRNEQYSDIMNVHKSSYVIIQKKVQDLDEKLNFIGQKIMPLEKAGDVNQRKIASMLDSIVEDQKKIAKITISRSKENADALMNSNDKLLLQMEEFRDSIAGMQQQLLSRQGEIRDEEAEKLDKSTDEIFRRMTELKELLEKEADEISENILTSKKSFEESYSNPIETAAESKNMDSEKEDLTENTQSEYTQDSTNNNKESVILPDEQFVSKQAEAVDKIGTEEVPPVLQQFKEENLMEEEVPEQSFVENQEAYPQEVSEHISVQDQTAIPEEQPVPEVIEESEQVSVAEEQPVPEPIIIPEQAVKSPIDSSKQESDGPMSPEDIAALIAKTESEDLPETTEKYEEEEKPPMPDMSDPNRPMSPEDIAALIANM